MKNTRVGGYVDILCDSSIQPASINPLKLLIHVMIQLEGFQCEYYEDYCTGLYKVYMHNDGLNGIYYVFHNFHKPTVHWLERITSNAKVATILFLIPASSDIVESEGRQMKQC